MIAKTPQPPYYAVIFTSLRTKNNENDSYSNTATRMMELAHQQPGFLGVESCRQEIGITVSYWKDLESIKTWKANLEHLQAQEQGKDRWYESYRVRVAKVERDYEFEAT
mmetsp:Transcript_18813/g.46615  ORF Transcript_18813/g.46615 Transcript_18813/m.46615 type:complete len:109 (-) Transcript_18813:311-637(-)